MSQCLVCAVLQYLLIFVSAALFLAYLYIKHAHSYWKRKGVECITPSVPFGNIGPLFDGTTHMAQVFEKIYEQAKGPFVGFYRFYAPSLLIKDPQLIKQLLVKDFNYFPDRGIHTDPDDPLSGHLFRLTGQKWKNLRVKLRPTFTSGKLKMMFPFLIHQGNHLQNHLKSCVQKGDLVDAKDTCICYTLDVIDSVAFGIETNSFENPDHEIRQFVRELFEKKCSYGRAIINNIAISMPTLMKTLGLKIFDAKTTDFMFSLLRRMIGFRVKNKETRNDFLQLLIQLKNKGEVAKEDDAGDKSVYDGKSVEAITFEELAAQAFVFLVAGFETSASTMSFALYELAKYPEVQKKAQKEVKEVLQKHGGEFSYECVYEMEYLGMVIAETLRMYPPLSFLSRINVENYEIPDSGVVLEKGTNIFVSLSGLHNDPEFFPNPRKFDPERFSNENKENIIPYSYMPFGEGPRNCIGMQMGKMQSRVGLAMILSKFSFTTCPETPKKISIKYGHVLIQPDVPIKLVVHEIK